MTRGTSAGFVALLMLVLATGACVSKSRYVLQAGEADRANKRWVAEQRRCREAERRIRKLERELRRSSAALGQARRQGARLQKRLQKLDALRQTTRDQADKIRRLKRDLVLAQTIIAGGLTASKARAFLKSFYFYRLRACLEVNRGWALLAVTVDSQGRVRRAKVTRSTFGSSKFAACLIDRVRKIRFPCPKRRAALRFDYRVSESRQATRGLFDD